MIEAAIFFHCFLQASQQNHFHPLCKCHKTNVTSVPVSILFLSNLHGFITPLNEYTYHILFSSTFRLLNSNRISSIEENAFAGLTSIHTL